MTAGRLRDRLTISGRNVIITLMDLHCAPACRGAALISWKRGRYVGQAGDSYPRPFPLFQASVTATEGETPKILITNREKTMRCNRRNFLKAGIAFSAATAIPSAVHPESVLAPQPGSWRTFRVTTKLDIREPSGPTKAWIPLPSVNEK